MNKDSCNHLLIGTLLGSVLGTATALLLAKKSGCELRQDIADKCEELCESLEDLSPRKFWAEPEPESNHTSLIVGGLLGSVVAAAAALLLTPKSGESLRKDLLDLGESGRDQVKDLVNALTNRRKHQSFRQRLRRK